MNSELWISCPTSSQGLGGTPPVPRSCVGRDGVGRCGRLRTQTKRGEGQEETLADAHEAKSAAKCPPTHSITDGHQPRHNPRTRRSSLLALPSSGGGVAAEACGRRRGGAPRQSPTTRDVTDGRHDPNAHSSSLGRPRGGRAAFFGGSSRSTLPGAGREFDVRPPVASPTATRSMRHALCVHLT